jgi:hypothetical protein
MIDLKKRFVKRNGEYHLLELADMKFMKRHNRLPDGCEEIHWKNENTEKTFCSLSEFLGSTLTHQEAKDFSKISSILGIPSFKRDYPYSEFPVNIYPIYWLEDYFGQG